MLVPGIKPTPSEMGEPLVNLLAKKVPHSQSELLEALPFAKLLYYTNISNQQVTRPFMISCTFPFISLTSLPKA